MHKPVLPALALATLPVLAGLLTLPSSDAAATDDPALRQVARNHGMSVSEVRAEMRDDRTLRASGNGRLYYVEPAQTDPATPRIAPQAAAPLDQTFLLHSDETSTKKVYLDFDGANVSGTEWNTQGLPANTYEGWSLDGQPGFGVAEQEAIQEVWRRVAEDFAPFDVDVTTEDPGPEALLRTNDADLTYGVRVLFSDSTAARNSLCGVGIACGGLAFTGTFNLVGSTDRYEPSWVFPPSLGPDDAAAMAEAASHEVGHNLGLVHDGIDEDEYYTADTLWGPIMGAPYGSGVTQWSKGDYPGAINPGIEGPRQDDVAIIGGVLGTRADEAPGGVAGAAALGDGHGFIASRTDTDTYALGDCTGVVTLTATPAETGANLDIKLELLDAAGTPVASDDPVATHDGEGSSSASGLGATVTRELGPGADYVRVDGVGRGSWATTNAYDDYGSLGEYKLTRSGTCGTGGGILPSAPTEVAANAHATLPQVVLSWQPPAQQGTADITGYQVSVVDGPSVTVAASERQHTVTGLEHSKTYSFKVAAVSSVGTGPSVERQATTQTAPTRPPSAPRNLTATPHPYLAQVSLRWAAPADPGTSPVTGYRVLVNGTPVTSAPIGGTAVDIGGLAFGTTYQFVVRAVSGAGAGSSASVSKRTASKRATRTTLAVPKKVRKGARPVVKVTVRPAAGAGTVPGRARLTVGKKTVTLTLRRGTASYAAPKQKKAGKVAVKATYLGMGAFNPSSATKRFKVRR